MISLKKIVFGLVLFASPLSWSANLEVILQGVQGQKGGSMLVSVFNDTDPDAFPEDVTKAIMKLKIPVAESKRFVIEGLRDGNYAIALLHDENGNDEMDKSGGMIKKPKEDFGFSNNAMGSFGPPSFKKAQFSVKGDTRISMRMKYMTGLSVKERE